MRVLIWLVIASFLLVFIMAGCSIFGKWKEPGSIFDDPLNGDFKNQSGANLPWINYGWDIGRNPWGGAHGGFSSNWTRLEADFNFLSLHGVKVVRVFTFCDLRSGILFNDIGWPVQFDDYALADFDALVEAAKSTNLRLIPVLLDYMVADGVEQENGVPVGEHPNLILDSTATQKLVELFQALCQGYASDPTILAWEIMNEPENASAVDSMNMETFINRVAVGLKPVTSTPITLGCRSRADLFHWQGVGLDILQFHYYDQMGSSQYFNIPASQLSPDRPVLIGEAQPSNLTSKLDTAYQNGYAGILFWSLNADYDFHMVAPEYQNWVETH